MADRTGEDPLVGASAQPPARPPGDVKRACTIPTQQSDLDLPLADDIRINDQGPVMRAATTWSSSAR